MQIAKEKSLLDELKADVEGILNAIRESEELSNFLNSPLIKIDKKKVILDKIFKSKINDLSLRFIMQIADQKREGLLEVICEEFIRQYNIEHNIAKVHLSTATKLNDAQRKEVLNFIDKNYDFKSVNLVETVDEDLIGGLILRIEDKQIDGSIKRKLQDIKQELIHA
tara:strand:+ start:770 stop:1270 length:501 start_codon:yes stop_codon:yes gene_type:complete